MIAGILETLQVVSLGVRPTERRWLDSGWAQLRGVDVQGQSPPAAGYYHIRQERAENIDGLSWVVYILFDWNC